VTGRLQKLEALLERVRRNRSPAPVRRGASPVAAPLALESVSAAPFRSTPRTPPMPEAVLSSPPVRVEPPVASVPPASVAPPVELPAPPVATPSWQPEPGSAVQARPTSIPPMEISDDDLIEVSTLPPEPEGPQTLASDSDAAETEETERDEQPPASSSRFKVPGTLDEALASAAQSETDREIPVKTPPPESGPQEALPASALETARMPDVEQLEADLSGPPSMGPTAEQLGETIELGEPRGPELEIDVTIVTEDPLDMPAPAEELEVSLPRPSMQSGLYDVAVTAPPPEPAVTVEAPPPAVREAVTMPTRAAHDVPERTLRPAIGATDAAEVKLITSSVPKTFVELLDASLGL
jgi:hypothetical protein